jgi:hypothetical protein
MSYKRSPYDASTARSQARSLGSSGTEALKHTLTRGAFENLADVMHRTKEDSEPHTHWNICCQLAVMCKSKNSGFKFNKFIERCGYPEASVLIDDIGDYK